jgi:ParB-like chromosome segregation protein Spo0J
MAKIVMTSARDIALDKLVASDLNVRRIKAGVSIEDMAEDIARRGLLQSLNVRPELDGEGAETSRFTVTAGGRRLAALKLLVKQKRLAKNAPVPCIVKVDGIEEEDSLAENTMREALLDHPSTNCLLAGLSGHTLQTSGQAFPQLLRGRRLTRRRHPKLVNGVRTSWGLHPCHVANGGARGEPFALT